MKGDFDKNKSLIPIQQKQLVKKVGNALEITSKLVSSKDYERIIELFIKHPAFFKRTISKYYPLKLKLIEYYKHIWEFGGCLSQNRSIKWTDDFIMKYIDQLNIWGLRGNHSVPWSLSLIDKLKENKDWEWEDFGKDIQITSMTELVKNFGANLDWSSLSNNRFIQWTPELIQEYSNNLDWEQLSGNESLPWTKELISKYHDNWDWNRLSLISAIPWSESLINKYYHRWDWSRLCLNKNVPWTDKLIIENANRINWFWLSKNPNVATKQDVFDKYYDHWDWEGLSSNENLPWGIAFIEKFKNMLDWERLSENIGLPWSELLIEKFEDKWDWDNLSTNDFLPWSVELINKYEDNWNWYSLGQGVIVQMPNFWKKIFGKIVNDKLIADTVWRLERLNISTTESYETETIDLDDYFFQDTSELKKLRKIFSKLNIKE